MKNLKKVLFVVVFILIAFVGGMFFANKQTEPEITSTLIQNRIEQASDLVTTKYHYAKVGKFENSLSLNGWSIPLTNKYFILTFEGEIQLNLENLDILNVRAEDLAKEKRECFDVVSARAVAKLSILLELCVPFVKMDHTMVALKGKNGHEELINAQKAIDTLGVELIDEEKFMIEEDATRINLYFKKVKHTPNKYPRAYGQIKKKPLEG